MPTYVYFYHNEIATRPTMKYYLLNAPTVEYFCREHFPIALLALTVLVVLVVLPMLLLFLYPLRCFQRLLNRLHLNSHVLHTFMDVFQGTFKDGTNGTRDYRSFSGFLLLNGFMMLMMFTWTLSSFYYPLAAIYLLLYCVLFIVFQPYKCRCHNYITIAMGTSLLSGYWGVFINVSLQGGMRHSVHYSFQGINHVFWCISIALMGVAVITPVLYLVGLVSVLINRSIHCCRVLQQC